VIVPAEQLWHVLLVDGWYLPIGQSLHATDASAEYSPPEHTRHSVVLYAALYLPATHGAHVPPLASRNWPGLHAGVGAPVGAGVGCAVGDAVGAVVGVAVGIPVGVAVGTVVGCAVGAIVGIGMHCRCAVSPFVCWPSGQSEQSSLPQLDAYRPVSQAIHSVTDEAFSPK
jgi:hypothetical protein